MQIEELNLYNCRQLRGEEEEVVRGLPQGNNPPNNPLRTFAPLLIVSKCHISSLHSSGNIKDLPKSVTNLNLYGCKSLEGEMAN